MLAFPEISGHLLFVLLLFCDSFFLMLSCLFCSETSLCRFGKSFCFVLLLLLLVFFQYMFFLLLIFFKHTLSFSFCFLLRCHTEWTHVHPNGFGLLSGAHLRARAHVCTHIYVCYSFQNIKIEVESLGFFFCLFVFPKALFCITNFEHINFAKNIRFVFSHFIHIYFLFCFFLFIPKNTIRKNVFFSLFLSFNSTFKKFLSYNFYKYLRIFLIFGFSFTILNRFLFFFLNVGLFFYCQNSNIKNFILKKFCFIFSFILFIFLF